MQPGLVARIELLVAEEDTAVVARTGDVSVLSTPRVIALVEETAVAAVAGRLDEGETTVSMRVQLDHLTPAAVGDTVTAGAKLEKVEGRRLIFSVSVTDARGLVAAGKITRVIVDRARFLDRS
ncbi:MAG: Thioesterase superfamily [Acidimicrobiales bacterium]|nr:Thioesterase superfamily [Acidimicrobiales bacterium]